MNPKFSPGEPAIIDLSGLEWDNRYEDVKHLHGARVIVITAEWRQSSWFYETIPGAPETDEYWGNLSERCLRPLPPKELAGCFDYEEIKQPNGITA